MRAQLYITIFLSLISLNSMALKGSLVNSKKHGQYFANLNGRKGILLCFHGTGGSAQGWLMKPEKKAYLEAFQEAGYAILCPTSKNRRVKKWDSLNNYRNRDVENIDDLLDDLGISQRKKVFLVGHSNGGGFVSRYSVLSKRSDQVSAVHYANSSGLSKIIENSNYEAPSFFGYARCDETVRFKKVEKNYKSAKKALGRRNVSKKLQDRLVRRSNVKSCHEFIDISRDTLKFFSRF